MRKILTIAPFLFFIIATANASLLGLFHAQSGGSAAPSSLLTGLVSYYKFQNTSDSAGSNTLTNNNLVTFVAGKVGNASTYVLGSSQYLDRASQTWGVADAWTFAFWFKSTTGNHNEGLVQLGNNGSAPVDFFKSDTDYVYTGCVFVNGLSVPANTWVFRVVTYDGAVTHIWDDDVDLGGSSAACGFSDSSRPLYVGTDSNGSGPLEYFGGQIDELGIWNRALTSGEIGTLWNSGAGTTYPF